MKCSLKLVSKGPVNIIPALVRIMAWGWPGDKPLSEPMMAYSVMHICVTQPQSLNSLRPSDTYTSVNRHQAIIWTNAGILFIGPKGTNFSKILIAILTFIQENAFESVVCEKAAILSRPQCVNVQSGNRWYLTILRPEEEAIIMPTMISNAFSYIKIIEF